MEQSDIQKYIDDAIEESLILDYKSADALAKTDGKRKEITKDVSALANSAGGRIIYGIKEFDDEDRRHLPERIDVVNRSDFSKEWLEQVINNIRPHIEGLIIHSVDVNTGVNDVVYVVEVPKSSTAHQATDHRYYKRFNFQSIAMEDYEVRDVMARQQYPKFILTFKIELETKHNRDGYDLTKQTTVTACTLEIRASNIGGTYAQYVNCFINLPCQLLTKSELQDLQWSNEEIPPYRQFYKDNTFRDVVDVKFAGLNSYPQYGPSRFHPILPKLSRVWSIEINEDFLDIDLEDLEIQWDIYADSAPPETGKVLISEIEIIDKR